LSGEYGELAEVLEAAARGLRRYRELVGRLLGESEEELLIQNKTPKSRI